MHPSIPALLLTAALLTACSGSSQSASTPPPTAQCDLNNPVAAARPAPAPVAPTPPAEKHALHNLHPLGPKMISGAVPKGDPAFDELRSLGVKTIISVDGATPDVARAAARGIRYVHIPLTYAEVSPQQQLEIARAVRDLPGPIYIHCHHGKHRSPAATASVAVALGQATPDEAVAFMKKAGTAPTYTGLYACAAGAVVLSDAALNAAPADFPAIRAPQGMTDAMVEIDIAYDHLGSIRAAGWQTPKDHPDLVPAAEAGRLADHLRFSHEDPKAKSLGDDFNARLAKAIAEAGALEEAIIARAAKPDLESKWKLVVASCKDCHVLYRDMKR